MEDLHALLRHHFGYTSFRPQQLAVIEHVLGGNDAVVLMPTGGGKSLCFQIPALILDGPTLVISPLIALMKDQVEGLRGNGVAAAFLNSTLNWSEEEAVIQELIAGRVKLLYVSPERLFQQGFLDRLDTCNVRLIAIDEAHCISSWGHHFRPDYKHLKVLKKRYPQIPIIALTATADKAVRQDIGRDLGLISPRVFISGFDRPNLSLSVLPGQNRWGSIQRILRRHPGECGIIYCNSRAATERMAAKLKAFGIRSASYHAGMGASERAQVQDEFISGRSHVICATIAFGMGIDKADVRFVIHYNVPGTVEGYYQEIGRAGRDGLPAETVLFYSYADVHTHLHFIQEIGDPRYREVLMAKMERMKEYAEAQVCRRTILLSYFSEDTQGSCGNCDVCKDPPSYFDGSLLAQKALSAILRSREQMGMSVLVDVLKGTRSPEVQAKGWYRIKTFGLGNDISAFTWTLFIQQFIQNGLLEVDYTDHYHLKVTRVGEAVLRGERPIRLVTPETIKERQAGPVSRTAGPNSSEHIRDEGLLAHLKNLRRGLAKGMGKPAYVVFSDASLMDMAERRPSTIHEFRLVHGVGDHKSRTYGEQFMKAIAEYEEAGVPM